MASEIDYQKIDKGFKQYYSLFDEEYKPVNKFEEWCDDNGYDDEDVKKWQNRDDPADFDDCIEFYDPDGLNKFPGVANPKNETTKMRKILQNILNGKVYTEKPPIDVNFNQFNFTDRGRQERDAMGRLLEKNLPTLYERVMGSINSKFVIDIGNVASKKEADFIRCFLVGQNNHYPQFTEYLHNSYVIDKIKCKIMEKHSPTEQEWVNANTFAKNKEDITVSKLIVDYGLRVIGTSLDLSVKVNDDIKEISEQFMWVSRFIHSVAHNLVIKQMAPFQVDLMFKVNHINQKDDDNDEKQDKKDKKDKGDQVGDILEKLKAAKVVYYPKDFKSEDKIDKDVGIDLAVRLDINLNYIDFLNEVQTKANDYPHNKRFSIFFDRTGKNKETRMVFFEPKENNTFPESNPFPEWNTEAIQTSLIPGTKINSNSSTGELLTFSFRVYKQDEVRCYLVYCNTQIILTGEYFAETLGFFFNGTAENKAYVEDNKEVLKEQFNKYIVDDEFQMFAKNIKKTKAKQSLKRFDQ